MLLSDVQQVVFPAQVGVALLLTTVDEVPDSYSPHKWGLYALSPKSRPFPVIHGRGSFYAFPYVVIYNC